MADLAFEATEPTKSGITLTDILDKDPDEVALEAAIDSRPEDDAEDARVAKEGYCVECEGYYYLNHLLS